MTKLNTYQKVILILLLAMVVIFAFVYRKTIFTVGYLYENEILVPSEVNGNTVYSGKIDGEEAKFVVSNGNTVEFYYGDKYFGPYVVTEDETAIPKEEAMADQMRGVELRRGDELIFRGGVWKRGSSLLFYGKGGNVGEKLTYAEMMASKEENQKIDAMEPDKSIIFELLGGPKLMHKGNWATWGAGAFLCLLTAITIIFEDALFHLRMRFVVSDTYGIEPSAWELANRYITWTATPIVALVLFILGLRY